MTNSTLRLAQQLIQQKSLTPDDANCQKIIAELLNNAGFTIEFINSNHVTNLWATHGSGTPLFVFAGHTDVVPTGDESQWKFPPFSATIDDGFLYGRGAADMKASLAAMISAAVNFVKNNPNHKGRIAFLITSDEEGDAIDGTAKVVETLKKRGEKIDYCIVGEATSEKQLGDTIKIGRRGSLNMKLMIRGVQGHVAYPSLAKNPIHHSLAFLQELTAISWDNGNEYFPATTFQISNIHAGTGAENVIPGILEITANFRFSTEVTDIELKNRINDLLKKHHLGYEIFWKPTSISYYSKPSLLTKTLSEIIEKNQKITATLSTTGGTSDGRFIKQICDEVIEFGPINASIHKINECINLEDLEKLTGIHEEVLKKILK